MTGGRSTSKTQRNQLAPVWLCVHTQTYKLSWLRACQRNTQVGQNENWETLERIEMCSSAFQLMTEGMSETIQTYFLRPK